MTTASYAPALRPTNRTRPAHRFGEGLDTLARRRPPVGPGWHVKGEKSPDELANRLTLAELLARGGRPRTSAPRRDGNPLASYLDARAEAAARGVGPFDAWLAERLREMARRARFLDAADGATFDDHDEACDRAAFERAEARGFDSASAAAR
jgi:hypothetical protein